MLSVVVVVVVVVEVVLVVLLLTTKSHTNRSHVSNIFHMRNNVFKKIFVFCKKHDFLLQKGTIHDLHGGVALVSFTLQNGARIPR